MARLQRLLAPLCHRMLVILDRSKAKQSTSSTLAHHGESKSNRDSNHANICRHQQGVELAQRRGQNVKPMTKLQMAAVKLASGETSAFTPSSMTPGIPTGPVTPNTRSVSELREGSTPDTSPTSSPSNSPPLSPAARAILIWYQQVYGVIGGPALAPGQLPPLDIGVFTAEGGTTRAFAIDGFQLRHCDDFIMIGQSLSVSKCSCFKDSC